MTPEYIIIHHSLTKDSGTVSWGAIRRYHMEKMGWSDIGYHYGVELVGQQYEVMKGRPPDVAGAHCKEMGMNRKSLGVCLVGNFDLQGPPTAQWEKAVELVGDLCRRYSVPVGAVEGHREVGMRAGFDWRKGQYKSCPGSTFAMNVFRADVQRLLEAPPPATLEERVAALEGRPVAGLEKRIEALEARFMDLVSDLRGVSQYPGTKGRS